MGAHSEPHLPVLQRSYDLCAGLYEHVNRFPRAQRGLLGRILLDEGLRILVCLNLAGRQTEKRATLAEASGRLDALRVTIRLSKRMGFLSHGGYERLSERIDEVGRMLGGWMKQQHAAHAEVSPKPPPSPASSKSGGIRYTMTSPTIEKYLRLKLEHPDAVVFVTVGAFCQTFFEDAAFCGRDLGLAVRDRAAAAEPEAIPMCGVPRHAMTKYTSRLREHGRVVHVE